MPLVLIDALMLDPSNPSGQFWIGLIVTTILGIAGITVAIVYRARSKKELTYTVLSDASIVNDLKELGEDIQVTLANGRDTRHARLLVLKVLNTGNAPLDLHDFNDLQFEYLPGYVLRSGLQSTDPPTLVNQQEMKQLIEIGPQDRYAQVKFHTLNPGDSFIMKMMAIEDHKKQGDEKDRIVAIRKKKKIESDMAICGAIPGGRIIESKAIPGNMKRRRLLIFMSVFIAGVLVTLALRPLILVVTGSCAPGAITVGGSSAFHTTVRQAERDYESVCPIASITVPEGSSGLGLSNLANEDIHIANAEVVPTTASQEMGGTIVSHQVGAVIFAVILHNGVSDVPNLTVENLRRIYQGEVLNWNELGGPNLPIKVQGRDRSSGSRFVFERLLNAQPDAQSIIYSGVTEHTTTSELIKAVTYTEGAIGYADLSSAMDFANVSGGTIVPLDEKVKPSVSSVRNGTYKFWGYEYMYTRSSPDWLTSSFINYVKKTVANDQFIISENNISLQMRQMYEE